MSSELETRLANMKRYRKEALLDPVANKLYLEDLAISIPIFEKAVARNKVNVSTGWVDNQEATV